MGGHTIPYHTIPNTAVIGALTGGAGNVLMLAGDIMDLSDTMDGLGAIGSVDTGSGHNTGSNHDLHFGGKHKSLRCHPNEIAITDTGLLAHSKRE
jgi:hypothetical protein